MLKFNNKFILMIILLLVFSILGGCKKKTPEGVSQEFYDDMIYAIEDLINTVNAGTKEMFEENIIIFSDGFSKVGNYEDKKNNLTAKEQRILDSIANIYVRCEVYYMNFEDLKDNSFTKDEIREYVETFSNFMEVELDIDKIIL